MTAMKQLFGTLVFALALLCLPQERVLAQCTGVLAANGFLAPTATTTNLSNVLTAVSSTAGWVIGMAVTGPNIPAGTTITGIGAGTLTMSANATGSAAGVAISNYTLVSQAGWSAPTVPATTTVIKNVTTVMGSNIITIGACNAALVTAGTPITVPSVPGGTTILAGSTCGTITISAVATASATTTQVFTLPAWGFNYPPDVSGITGVPLAQNCSVCPSLFSRTLCADEYASYYMCAGNVYTITMCATGVTWNSTLSVTGPAGTFNASTGFATFDDDGCGTPSGHASLVYAPATSATYSIRLFRNNGSGNSCLLDFTQCGTVSITCSPAPPPPTNDNPCGAMPLTAGSSCSFAGATTSWATATGGAPAVGCGSYSGVDVWFTSVATANGLAIQTNHVGAANLAMAAYTATGVCPTLTFTQIPGMCNADLLTGTANQPYLLIPSSYSGQTIYIRVWPQSGSANGGTFEICTYDPIPPPNDNPCGALPVLVDAGCTQVTSNNQNATATAGIPVPSCGGAGPYNDVWFTMTVPAVPAGSGVIINTASPTLNDAALAVYIAGSCAGAFTEVGCNDPAGPMPSIQINQNGGTIVAGTVLYVRFWHKNAVFANFTICATPTFPPANNEPCGAIAVPVEYGCIFDNYSNINATTTPASLAGQHVSVPNPTCGGTPNNDVWFTVQVPNPFPGTASLIFDTDDFALTDGGMAVYRVASGSCAGGNLALTQLNCQTVGPVPASNPMPQVTVPSAGLSPGETLYVRVWRQTGTDGSFQFCARRNDLVPGGCNYSLRMSDSAGDGWGGSYVTVCVNAVCTNYSIIGSTGSISFAAPIGATITLGYTAAGGFQNQISYQLLATNGGIIFSSGSPPVVGPFVYAITVNSACNVPPAPHEDCVGAHFVCGNTAQSANPQNTGAVADINTGNRGCLITNERRGVWYAFQVSAPGQIGFTINPFPYGISDYDFGLWGPYPSVICPPNTLPIRCSWADGPSLTGLNWVATDVSEGVFGDSWNMHITAATNDIYILYVDNWYMTGFAFDLTFTFQPNCGTAGFPPCASISCTLPVEFLGLNGERSGAAIALEWATASEDRSSHFVVERSKDGTNFHPIGRVEAQGFSSTFVSYDFVDRSPAAGINYYRLAIVDLEGNSLPSNTVAVNFRSGDLPIQLYPNPANDVLVVTSDIITDHALEWRILDASGRIASTGNAAALDDAGRLSIPVGDLDAGSYLFELKDVEGGSRGNARFVKQ